MKFSTPNFSMPSEHTAKNAKLAQHEKMNMKSGKRNRTEKKIKQNKAKNEIYIEKSVE